MEQLPLARQEGLIVRELPDEVLVYDLSTDKAHCLNQTSALIWKHCDGQTTVGELVRLIEREMKTPADADVVWLALKQLERFKLLEERVQQPAKVSRRDLILKYAPATLVLPVILSISAPTAAQAGSTPPPPSCLPDGASCSVDSDCCSFNCNGGVCGPAL